MGDDDILRRSVCLVDKPVLSDGPGQLYDARMGIVDSNSRCATCRESVWQCPGHFGHLNFDVPVIVHYKKCLTYLRCVCFHCRRLTCDADELRAKRLSRSTDRALKYVASLTYCARCKNRQPELRLNTKDYVFTASHKLRDREGKKILTPEFIKSVFDQIPDDDVRALGIDVAMFHPRNLVLTRFPVIPICGRPRMMSAAASTDDDLSVMLMNMIKYNAMIVKASGAPAKRKEYDKAVAMLRMFAHSYFDNSRGRATHNTNHKAYVSMTQRISTKAGSVRRNLMAKRANRSARSVVGPDPTLKLDEIGVPEEIARLLTITEHVTPFNIDSLTRLVNAKVRVASLIVRKNGEKLNVANATTDPGTRLMHGDVVVRDDGRRVVVTNCRMELSETDSVIRRASTIEERVVMPSRRHVALYIGDSVERHLANGDHVIINRQPTLHRNSMIAMRVVIKPGKAFRLNLAVTKQLNMDFDGDECNVFVMNSLTSRAELELIVSAKCNMLSAQTNKSEIAIVQDSLLAAYQMTVDDRRMTRAHFFNCILRTSTFDRYPDAFARLAFANARLGRSPRYASSATTFAFILPADFHKSWSSGLTIRDGVVVAGHFDKSVLQSGADSIVRLLCMEYGRDVAATFVDDVQFLTNAWLELNPFSIGLQDCFMNCDDTKRRIRDTTYRQLMCADAAAASTDNEDLKRAYVNAQLNKSQNLGLRIAKEALDPSNGFLQTVLSGSKGDFFNIGQITGLLGQQNVNGGRPPMQLDGGKRSFPHYPPLVHDVKRRYESRGFVSDCFIDGLGCIATFCHAMSGREGMTNTAMGTSTTGYMQRSCVKHNEDMKIAYDGTVRDANGNLYEHVYGHHGFDPTKVDFLPDGDVRAIDVGRLSDRLCTPAETQRCSRRALTDVETDALVARCRWRNAGVPDEIFDRVWQRHERRLRADLAGATLVDSVVDEFCDRVVTAIHCARIAPGEAVGVLSAQSIGQQQTQTNLNTFHTAGKLQESGTAKFGEFIRMSRTVKRKTSIVYFRSRYATARELKSAIAGSIVPVTVKQLCGANEPKVVVVQSRADESVGVTVTNDDDAIVESSYSSAIEFLFDANVVYANAIDPVRVASRIRNATTSDRTSEVRNVVANAMSVTVEYCSTDRDAVALSSTIAAIVVGGIAGINAIYFDYDGTEWYAVLDGGNLCMLLAHPLVDAARLYTNDLWEIYDVLGIAGFKRFTHRELGKLVGAVNDCHVRVLVNKMTHAGHPTAINRYSMLTNDTGTLSKATFENMVHHFVEDSTRTRTDPIRCVSSAIICGNIPRIGTGMIGLKPDLEAIASAIPANGHPAGAQAAAEGVSSTKRRRAFEDIDDETDVRKCAKLSIDDDGQHRNALMPIDAVREEDDSDISVADCEERSDDDDDDEYVPRPVYY